MEAQIVQYDGEFFIVGEQVYNVYIDKEKLRKKALAKLTPEERELLGLKR